MRQVIVALGLVTFVGCGSVAPDGGSGGKSDKPNNTLSDIDNAAFCASHLADCEKQYPKCDAIRSPYYDETAADRGRCRRAWGIVTCRRGPSCSASRAPSKSTSSSPRPASTS